ncbi:hypothetical protein GCM10009624_33130 [Gordonia sinesedis]
MWDIGSGLAGVLGAIAGGIGTYAATWLSLRKQEHQVDKQRRNQLQDRRHAAHEQMVISLYKFVDSSREVETYLDAKTPVDPQVDKAYLDAWGDLNIVRAAALIAGPKELSQQLNETIHSAAQYSNALDRRLADNGKAKDYGDLREACRISINTYVDAARGHLSLDR